MEQLSFDIDSLVEEKELSSDIRGESFSCCAHYRECSDQKMCVNANDPDSYNCAYRHNLDNGEIYYGKNSKNFNIELYKEWVEKYRNLDNSLRFKLNCILTVYSKYRSVIFCYSSQEIDKLSELGFVIKSVYKKDILTKCKHKVLKSFLNEDMYAILKAKAVKSRGNHASPKKDEIILYILENYVPKAEAFINKYSFVHIPPSFRNYAFEIYYDFIAPYKTKYELEKPVI